MTDDDLAAYGRIRARGLQPKRITGCAAIEANATRDRLKWPDFTDERIASVKEAMALAADLAD